MNVKIFSALRASMRCFQHCTIPVNSKKQQQIGIKYKLYQLVCWLLSESSPSSSTLCLQEDLGLPELGKCSPEDPNPEDKHSVAVHLLEQTVGHITREQSRVSWCFLKHGGLIITPCSRGKTMPSCVCLQKNIEKIMLQAGSWRLLQMS